jgi:serine/threonine-protein kinase
MKLVRGRRLDEVGSAGNLPDRLRLFERVCEAVAFAHAAGVIHRDLKPQNIMVGPFGEVLVMDWGIAKRHERAAAPSSPGLPPGRDTDHGTVLGTPGYMAPEQARGDIEQVDERADVYALGALLAFLLGTDAPRALVAVCRKAMAARAGERYPGAAALADDVGRFLSHRRVAAYPEGLLGAGRRLVARHRVAVVLVLAYLSVRALVFFWARR